MWSEQVKCSMSLQSSDANTITQILTFIISVVPEKTAYVNICDTPHVQPDGHLAKHWSLHILTFLATHTHTPFWELNIEDACHAFSNFAGSPWVTVLITRRQMVCLHAWGGQTRGSILVSRQAFSHFNGSPCVTKFIIFKRRMACSHAWSGQTRGTQTCTLLGNEYFPFWKKHSGGGGVEQSKENHIYGWRATSIPSNSISDRFT